MICGENTIPSRDLDMKRAGIARYYHSLFCKKVIPFPVSPHGEPLSEEPLEARYDGPTPHTVPAGTTVQSWIEKRLSGKRITEEEAAELFKKWDPTYKDTWRGENPLVDDPSAVANATDTPERVRDITRRCLDSELYNVSISGTHRKYGRPTFILKTSSGMYQLSMGGLVKKCEFGGTDGPGMCMACPHIGSAMPPCSFDSAYRMKIERW